MPDDWNKRLWAPVKPRGAQAIATLADARKYMLKLPNGTASRPEWQRAIEAVMGAAKGTISTHTARDALVNALFVNMNLDLSE